MRPPVKDATLYEAFWRLRAELELKAFEVVVLDDGRAPSDADALERLSEKRGAFAAIALRRNDSGGTAEILIVDRVTGKSTIRKLRIDPSSAGPTLLAVAATDLLRTSLAEFAPGEQPPKDVVGVEAEPPPPEVARFAREMPRFEVRAGGMVLLSQELGYSAGPVLGARFHPARRFAVGLDACGPLSGAEFSANNGVSSVRQEFAVVVSSWTFSSAVSGPRWAWAPFLGAGVYHLRATGIVAAPLVGETSDFWSFVSEAGLSVQRFFGDNLGLALHAGAIALLPRPVIALDQERSAPIPLQGQLALSFRVAF